MAQAFRRMPPSAEVSSSRLSHSRWVSWWTKRSLGRLFAGGFFRFLLAQISFHHFSTVISFISFHIIHPCDDVSGQRPSPSVDGWILFRMFMMANWYPGTNVAQFSWHVSYSGGKASKKPQPWNWPYRGSNQGPLHEKQRCNPLDHNSGHVRQASSAGILAIHWPSIKGLHRVTSSTRSCVEYELREFIYVIPYAVEGRYFEAPCNLSRSKK